MSFDRLTSAESRTRMQSANFSSTLYGINGSQEPWRSSKNLLDYLQPPLPYMRPEVNMGIISNPTWATQGRPFVPDVNASMYGVLPEMQMPLWQPFQPRGPQPQAVQAGFQRQGFQQPGGPPPYWPPAQRPPIPRPNFQPLQTLPSGLKFQDTQVGQGAVAMPGQSVTVHYTGTLLANGKKFDSSLDRREPFTFNLGAGEVIQGWDQGVAGMREGGKRVLLIPAHLAYGKRGAPPDIPPNAPLRFEVTLLKAQ